MMLSSWACRQEWHWHSHGGVSIPGGLLGGIDTIGINGIYAFFGYIYIYTYIYVIYIIIYMAYIYICI
jgi:hypothetical protein